jgi:hypothetical protein
MHGAVKLVAQVLPGRRHWPCRGAIAIHERIVHVRLRRATATTRRHAHKQLFNLEAPTGHGQIAPHLGL